MPTREELKLEACRQIERQKDEVIGVARAILESPEPGFREVKTSRYVASKFEELGIAYRDKLALTGIKGVVAGGGEGPTVAVLGELDSLIVPDHPKANPETGAAHACGHHAQIAMMLGVARAITSSGVLPFLSGRVVFMAVPAEEYIEIEFRDELRKQGKLSYLGGKPELIKLGEFDDIDIAMLTHTSSAPEARKLARVASSNGIVAKRIQFVGRSAHAGSAPHRGINALNAAMIALSAIHAQRETFKDNDTVRVHPIITKGGDAVNAVPADVRMETFVRGKTLEAVLDANEKVDRALRAGALAVGARVNITTLPGYLPLVTNEYLDELYREEAVTVVGEDNIGDMGHITASTDMGDISQLMPVIHPMAGGASGIGHGNDYFIDNYEMAVLNPAKAMTRLVIELLADGALKAKEVLGKSKSRMTKQEYLSFMDRLLRIEEYQG